MSQAALREALRSIVAQHGFEQVEWYLKEIGISDLKPHCPKKNQMPRSKSAKAKATAPEYVAKIALPSEKEAVVADLAKNFHEKSFLPTFGEIANFCRAYGIEEPASKSRVNAIPRVFKFIAGMETEQLRRILDDGLFAGPSRLGPIADAIRRNGRANRY